MLKLRVADDWFCCNSKMALLIGFGRALAFKVTKGGEGIRLGLLNSERGMASFCERAAPRTRDLHMRR